MDPRRRSGRVRKISPQPGLEPRKVQPVASCYTGPQQRMNAALRVQTKKIIPTQPIPETHSWRLELGTVCVLNVNEAAARKRSGPIS